MPLICVSLTEETTAGVVERMAELAPLADLFEIRADLILDLDLLTILRAKTRPLILTCRAESEGGRWPDDDPRRKLTLLEGVKRGFDWVDIEHRSAYLDVMIEKLGNGLIVSRHDLDGTPEDLDGLYLELSDKGADVVKMAVTPKSFADVARLMAFAERTSRKDGPPLVALALGPLGVITRLLAGRYKAPFTYASASAGKEAAPGQLSVALMADLYRVRELTAATKVYGILGRDVLWSLSPVLHNRAFEARGLDAVYLPLQADTLEPFMSALPTLRLSGFSITRPYKTEILPYLDEVEEPAEVCGSVNTVTINNGSLRGSTSDGTGVLAPLKKRIDPKGRRVVILGCGGAARAAALALVRKAAQVTILGRSAAKAAAAAAAVGAAHGSLEDASRLAWDVIINATPLGSNASPERTPLPAERHRPGTVAFDMVYDPLETRFLREAQAVGCTTIGGLEMLLSQAAVQFETWTDVEAPTDVMKSAALYLAQEQAS